MNDAPSSPTTREAAAMEAAQRALDMLGLDLARYETTSWRCRDTARAFLAAGFAHERLGVYFERAFARALHDRVHSYNALPDEYVGNNLDLVADAYLAGGDVTERLEPLAEVLGEVVKYKGNILPHRLQQAFAMWGAGRKHDNRVRRTLSAIRNADAATLESLDLNVPRARAILAIIEGNAEEAARWLREYDAALAIEESNPRQRIHLITFVIWLIARDRYNLHLPTEGLRGLPPLYVAPAAASVATP